VKQLVRWCWRRSCSNDDDDDDNDGDSAAAMSE